MLKNLGRIPLLFIFLLGRVLFRVVPLGISRKSKGTNAEAKHIHGFKTTLPLKLVLATIDLLVWVYGHEHLGIRGYEKTIKQTRTSC